MASRPILDPAPPRLLRNHDPPVRHLTQSVFRSVAELEAAIETWLTERNAKPKPFKWTAKAHTILEKNARARRALEEAVSGVSNE